MEKFNDNEKYYQKLEEAFAAEDSAKLKEVFQMFENNVLEKAKKNAESLQEQLKAVESEQEKNRILMSRGYRVLTNEEKKWYEALSDFITKADKKQSLADFLTEVDGDSMPTTIIEDVFKDLVKESPILSKLNARFVGYLTKVLLNNHPEQTAIWGKITAAITQEITSAFKEIKLNQNKLSCFAVISRDFLEDGMGPVFLDSYIREVLKMAMRMGLEKAVVAGNGIDCPIGIMKNIKKGVTFSTTDGYPDKEAIKATDFKPVTYGKLLSNLVTKENGSDREFNKVTMICNLKDYLLKIMPATTVQNSNGDYTRDVLPFPTEIVTSRYVPEGKCLIAVLDEYYLGLGLSRNDVIEQSDDVKFLEDQRVFKMVQYAAGQMEDDTSAVLVDISNLQPNYITVEQKATAIGA